MHQAFLCQSAIEAKGPVVDVRVVGVLAVAPRSASFRTTGHTAAGSRRRRGRRLLTSAVPGRMVESLSSQ
jgi:hypothetical protein